MSRSRFQVQEETWVKTKNIVFSKFSSVEFQVLPFPHLCTNLPHCDYVVDFFLDQTGGNTGRTKRLKLFIIIIYYLLLFISCIPQIL